MITGLAVAAGAVVKVAGLALILGELAARVGSAPAAFVSRRRWEDGERAAIGFLLGWAVFGAALLGLAATGLFFPPLVAAVLLAPSLVPRHARPRRLALADMLGAAGGDRGWGRAALLAALAPAIAALPLPDLSWDSAVYHLGFPWQCLMLHRLPIDAVPLPFWTPLPADLALAVPLVLGDERIGKAVGILHLLALAALWQARCRRDRMPDAGWLGVVLVPAAGLVPVLLTSCKNDLVAGVLCATGALLLMRGAAGTGAALLGAGVTAKFVFLPAVVCWILAFPPRPRRLRPVWVLLLAAPIVPWLARSWLAIGHLGVPYLFPGSEAPNWTAMNQSAFRFFQDQLGAVNVAARHGLIRTWWALMLRDAPALLATLALLLCVRSTRRAGVGLIAGLLVTLWLGRLSKYGLPASLLAACLAAGLLASRRARIPRWLPFLAGAVALAAGWRSPAYREIAWREAAMPWPAARRAAGTAFDHAVEAVAGSHARRILTIGDWRTYRIPGRVLYGGTSGETPISWTLAREARTPGELRKRVRQLGAELLLFNFVTTEWLEVRYGAFVWDRRMLRVYTEFCKGYLAERWRSGTCDFRNGGFYLYGLRSRARSPLPATVWFAPGIEPVFAEGTFLLSSGRPGEAVAAFRRVLGLIPDVGQAWNKTGNALISAGEPKAALACLRTFGEQGMLDAMNLPELGAAALQMGELATAERVLAEVLVRYPTHPLTRRLLEAGGSDRRQLRRILREAAP